MGITGAALKSSSDYVGSNYVGSELSGTSCEGAAPSGPGASSLVGGEALLELDAAPACARLLLTDAISLDDAGLPAAAELLIAAASCS